MLTRLYVDNFRALVNNDLTFSSPKSLLIGTNGTGKSTFGEVLVKLQLLLAGQTTDDTFTVDTLTRWQSEKFRQQRFEIDAKGPAGVYRYELVIDHRDVASVEEKRTRILREALTLDSQPIFRFEKGVVYLYRDDQSVGPEYPFDWARSAIGTISPRHDNQKLSWFLRWIRGLTVLRPNPAEMLDIVERDDFFLFLDAKNFAAWYHTASAADKRRDRSLHDSLTDVLQGFDALNFEPAGPNRWLLRADFVRGGEKIMFRFAELSDGQRALILLYCVLSFLLYDGRTVFLDEPDNFVSLDEIQPWLLSASDLVDDGFGQLVLISHHPEIFNQWAIDYGQVAERDGCGPVRIHKYSQPPGIEITPAEAIARGWSNGDNAAEIARP